MSALLLANVTCVAIAGRGVLIEGRPGSGKSSLALALIDRGAVLVGDDGIAIERRGQRVWAYPPPNIAGLIEIRGVGIADVPTTTAPLCLSLTLAAATARVPEPAIRTIAGADLPSLFLDAALPAAPLRVEWALRLHGLATPPADA